ncbi:MAG: hypothetical protein H0V30_12460 [Chitinophagaceae bacterium]|jgi:ribosome maturation protein Sdo1|nr:hypothetical protein [Chitinophagaceae bacterium]
MQELISQLTSKVGLNEDQAKIAVQVITDYIGEKYPMIKAQIANLTGGKEKGDGAPQVGGIDLSGLG